MWAGGWSQFPLCLLIAMVCLETTSNLINFVVCCLLWLYMLLTGLYSESFF